MKGMRLGGLAAGLFAAGMLTGFAGTAVARDGASTDGCDARMAEHAVGDGMADTMSMMRAGPMMGGGQHGEHHSQTTPGTVE
jgi:hypothetical protein